jgi:hypothetical protein
MTTTRKVSDSDTTTGRRCWTVRLGIAAVALALVSGIGMAGTAYADASGCTGFSGAGDLGRTCITVRGTGLQVDEITGELQSAKNSPPYATQMCRVSFQATGILYGGAPYSETLVSQCGYGDTYVVFHPNRKFAPYSKVCMRATFQGNTGDPACETIY